MPGPPTHIGVLRQAVACFDTLRPWEAPATTDDTPLSAEESANLSPEEQPSGAESLSVFALTLAGLHSVGGSSWRRDPDPTEQGFGESAVDDSNDVFVDDQHRGVRPPRTAAERAERTLYAYEQLLESYQNTPDLAGARWLAAEFRKLGERHAAELGSGLTLWTRALNQEELDAQTNTMRDAFQELLKEYDQDRLSDTEPDPAWAQLWWWSQVFEINDLIAAWLGARSTGSGVDGRFELVSADELLRSIDFKFEEPTEEELFGPGGKPLLNLTARDRLDTLLQFVQTLDPDGAAAEHQPGYRFSRAAATFLSGGGTFEDVDRRLAGDQAPHDRDVVADAFDGYQPGRLEELLDEFQRGVISPGDLPEAWITTWRWAHLFHVEDSFAELLEQRRHLLGIPLFERPSLEQAFGPDGPPTVGAEPPERLYAIVNFYERIDPHRATDTPREYLAIRDFAVGTSGFSVDDVNRALRGLQPVPAHEGAATEDIEPPTMELDPDTPDTFVAPPPRPRRGRHPAESATEAGLPSPDTTSPPEADAAAEPRPTPVGTNQSHKDSIVDPLELQFDTSEAEEIDSAVDDWEPTGRAGRGLDIPPFTPPVPPPPNDSDSAPDDSDGVTTLASAGGQAGSGMLGSPRRRVIAGIVALLAVAVIAAVAFTGNNDDVTDDFAIAPTPNSSGTAETGTAVDPTAASTDQPAMTIAPVAELIVCINDPSASFSGFVQPDGTVLDADTGEPRACPASDN